MSIFLNRYQIRHVYNDATPGTWESVAVGVFSKPGRMPIFIGIEMRYEVGDVPLRELEVDIHGDMRLTTMAYVLLTQSEVHELARLGVIQTEEGIVQMLSAKR